MTTDPTMLLKTQDERRCAGADPTIFMKTNNLTFRTHDVHENTGSYALKRAGWKQTMQKLEKIASLFARACGIAVSSVRCQALGAGCQVSARASAVGLRGRRSLTAEKSGKNEGSSGDVNEKKEQVLGIWAIHLTQVPPTSCGLVVLVRMREA